jgi:ADP-heptose:LPS heptosyltransferase
MSADRPEARARRILVIHPGALGDVLLALPALAHLGRLLPGGHRTLAAAPRLARLLGGSAWVEHGVDLDGLGLHRLFVEDPPAGTPGGVAGYDVIVSWLGAGEPAFRARLGRLATSVVVARAAPPPGSATHCSRHLLETLAPLGSVPVPGSSSGLEARLVPVEAERLEARIWLRTRGLDPGQAVMLHPGAGSAAKAWPGFPALARRLADAAWPLVVAAGPADRAAVAAVMAAGVPRSMVVPEWPLSRLAALFAEARTLVGNDSGLCHLSAAVGCPTLALFGPTDPRVWAPLGDHVTALGGDSRDADDPWAGLTVARVEDAMRTRLGPGRWPGGPPRRRALAPM